LAEQAVAVAVHTLEKVLAEMEARQRTVAGVALEQIVFLHRLARQTLVAVVAAVVEAAEALVETVVLVW
jgi:hypothetical protein